jgi:hypothetical protein
MKNTATMTAEQLKKQRRHKKIVRLQHIAREKRKIKHPKPKRVKLPKFEEVKPEPIKKLSWFKRLIIWITRIKKRGV